MTQCAKLLEEVVTREGGKVRGRGREGQGEMEFKNEKWQRREGRGEREGRGQEGKVNRGIQKRGWRRGAEVRKINA